MRRDWINNPSIIKGRKMMACPECNVKRYRESDMEWHRYDAHGVKLPEGWK